jgi:hypothetical protein
VFGIAAAVVLFIALRQARSRTDEFPGVLVAIAGVVAISPLIFSGGLGFVPGLVPAFPLVVAGVLWILTNRRRETVAVVGTIAGVALVLAWAFQFKGGSLPQWGGRYVLTTTLALGALGACELVRTSPAVRRALVGLCVVMTALGAAWVVQRTRSISDHFDALAADRADVVVGRNGFWIREGGARYTDRRWLTADDDAKLAELIDVLDEADVETFGVLDGDREGSLDDPRVEAVETRAYPVLDVAMYLHEYRLRRP